MEENPEAQKPRTASSRDHKADDVGGVLREAMQAESEGLYAHASLLALHALQLDPGRTEATAIFDRCQAALGRKTTDSDASRLGVPRPRADLRRPARHSGPPDAPGGDSIEKLFRDDALRHPIDLAGVQPLMPASQPRGLGFRVFRAVLPFVVLGLFVAGIWLTSRSPEKVPSAAEAPPAVAEPDSDSIADPAPATLPPGTASLDIVPWAKVDSIVSLYDGHEIEPEGLVSPCTISLPPGRYSFTVSHPDYGSTELPVIVKSGEVTKVEHSLISSQDLEKELAPALKSVGYPPGRTKASGIRQSAELRR